VRHKVVRMPDKADAGAGAGGESAAAAG
jgi:hypothetical protein